MALALFAGLIAIAVALMGGLCEIASAIKTLKS